MPTSAEGCDLADDGFFLSLTACIVVHDAKLLIWGRTPILPSAPVQEIHRRGPGSFPNDASVAEIDIDAW
ncbi:MAG: hypothetical protein DRI40_00655 [Chloroflexi bacterium]|nr:MAG: hypothetical protein DRI40_00655 [Chloroflexota bacterium]